jgi:hypothetical protein
MSHHFRTFAALVLCPATAFAVEPVNPSAAFQVGVCTHFSQGKGLLPANLSLIRQAGATTLRDEVGWSRVEGARGVFKIPEEWDDFVRRAVAANVEPLLILDYGNRFYDGGDKPRSSEALEAFAVYCEFVVRHFKGVVHQYEIWNEYDIKIGGTTPGPAEDYAAMLKKVYPRIKAIDPSIEVLGGAMTSGGVNKGWLERMLAADALPYLDAVSVHSYSYSQTGRGRSPETWAAWIAGVQETIMKHNNGKPAPLYVTEMGWPTEVDKRGTPPQVAADYLARMFLLGRSMPYLKGIWWYDFQDDGWNATDNENNFGMVRPDLTPKQAYFALASVSEVVAGGFVERLDAGDPDVYVLKFRAAGRNLLAIWSVHEEDDWQVTLKGTSPIPTALTVAKLGGRAVSRAWGARAWADERPAVVAVDELVLTVRGCPWIVGGDLAGVTVAGVKRRVFPDAMPGVSMPVSK